MNLPFRLSSLIGVAAMLLATSAHTETPKKPLPSPGETETRAMHGLAGCIASRAGADTRAVLKLYNSSPTFRDALIGLTKKHSQCTFATIKMDGVLFPAALAEAMLHKEYSQSQLAGLLRAPEPAMTARTESEYTGTCLVLAHPQDAAALLFSDPVSTEAETLISGFAPRLANCVHKGQTLRINKAGLRSIMALSAYRLAALNAGVNSATGKN